MNDNRYFKKPSDVILTGLHMCTHMITDQIGTAFTHWITTWTPCTSAVSANLPQEEEHNIAIVLKLSKM